MRLWRTWLLCLAAMGFLACLVGGCGRGDSSGRASVEGKVTLDGNPIERGSISFYPYGQTRGMVAGGVIEQGRYSIPADQGPVIGQNRVEIRAPKKTGKKIPDPYGKPGQMIDEIAEAVPEQYNVKSTLVREVKAGRNILDFDLRTQ